MADALLRLETDDWYVREIDKDYPDPLLLIKHTNEIDLDDVYGDAHPCAENDTPIQIATVSTTLQS